MPFHAYCVHIASNNTKPMTWAAVVIANGAGTGFTIIAIRFSSENTITTTAVMAAIDAKRDITRIQPSPYAARTPNA